MEILEKGMVFGKLTIIEQTRLENGRKAYLVNCECGNKTKVPGYHLKSGNTKSCGCGQREAAKINATKHGMWNHPLYSTWDGMMARCYNENSINFHLYGGRCIQVCERWHDPRNFISDMPPKPGPEYEIDRKDNDGPYCPDNVQWSTRKDNSRNMRSNVWTKHDGQDRLLIEVAEEKGFKPDTLRSRLDRGDVDLLRPLRPGQRDVKKRWHLP